MSSDATTSREEILNAYRTATDTFNLCPNRVWAVGRHELPTLIRAAKELPTVDDHSPCTVDFCIYSQRDFTAVEQRHECEHGNCRRLKFVQEILEKAAKEEQSTVWTLDRKDMLERPLPYMAISHVWSDGTGNGSWPDGQVNECLYDFFANIARRWYCKGIWWDTLSIPREKAARTLAIKRIQRNYQDARITLVHDCFLRNTLWVGAEAACFAILMSPWFSRGWTALELAMSQKVKVLFKGPHGFLIKDLDLDILAEEEEASDAHRLATDMIRSLRNGITTLDDLLIVLGPRFTSWPKDMAIISGLLVGVNISPEGTKRDVTQQDIYTRILIKIGTLTSGHLFHNSATICKGSSWCPINLFSMPISKQPPSLTVDDNLNLNGLWDIIPVSDTLEQNCIWNGTHPLLRIQIQLTLKDVDGCVLLAEPGTEAFDRALLVKSKGREGQSGSVYCQYVGALYFNSKLPRTKHIKTQVTILGDAESHMASFDGNAWEIIKETESQRIQHTNPLRTSKKVFLRRPAPEIQSLWPTKYGSPAEDFTKWTALHYAIWRGDYTSFEQLIKISDIYAKDRLNQRPLDLAAARGDAMMFKLLLDKLISLDWKFPSVATGKDALVNTMRHGGESLLHYAVLGRSESIVDSVLRLRGDINRVDDNSNTALHIALITDYEPLVERLLGAGADPNARDGNNNTTLHIAVITNYEPLVERLLGAGADPNAKDGKGNTALHIAVKAGREPLVERLLKWKASPNLLNHNESTALSLAVSKSCPTVIQRLLEAGADPKFTDDDHNTMLHIAAKNACEPVVGVLLEFGLNPNNRNSSNDTALDIAVRSGCAPVVSRLLSGSHYSIDLAKFPHSTLLCYAVEHGQEEIVRLLVENGADVNLGAYEFEEDVPLQKAASKHHYSIMEFLISKGADVNHMTDTTALHITVRGGVMAAVRLLIESGADLNVEDWSGHRPLHYARDLIMSKMLKKYLENGI